MCGRGKACSTAEGNRRLKMIVTQYLKLYSEARNKLDKSAIVSRIVNVVKQAASEGAFVKFEQGRWWQVEDGPAREKVGCIFRDCLHTQYRSSTKAKLARRRARKVVSDDMASLNEGNPSHHTSSAYNEPPFHMDPPPARPPSTVYLKNFIPKNTMQEYCELQSTYLAEGCRSQSFNILRDVMPMPMSSHFDIMGNHNNIMGNHNNINSISSARNSNSSNPKPNIVVSALEEACDLMGLNDDSADSLPDDISNIFDD